LLLLKSFIVNNNIVLPRFTGCPTNLTATARPETSTHDVEKPQKLPTRFAEEPLLGITGSLVGGGIAFMLRLGIYPYQPAGWIFSIVGAIVLLAMGFFGMRRRIIS